MGKHEARLYRTFKVWMLFVYREYTFIMPPPLIGGALSDAFV